MNDKEQLRAGLAALALPCTEAQLEKLVAYLALLAQWTLHTNLVSKNTLPQAVTRHLLDCLAAAPYIEGGRIADVGSGAGLPGIPLAIVFPERAFTLIETNGKKCRFLSQVKTELGLANLSIENARVERIKVPQGFTTVITRAFASLADTVALVDTILASGGVLLCLKGTKERTEQELGQLQAKFESRLVELGVPGLAEQRRLVILRKPTSKG